MSRRLVLLASGWSKPRWLWAPMAYRFASNGYDTIRIDYPTQGFGCIIDNCSNMEAFITKVCPQYDEVVFIGHSMGGLVGRKLIHDGYSDLFSAYITLGTPHFGAPLAKYGFFSPSARQMKPNSDFLNDINSREIPESLPTLTVSGTWDPLVPHWSSKLPSPAENLVKDRVSHTTLLTNSRVFYEIWSWLTFSVFNDTDLNTDRGIISSLV